MRVIMKKSMLILSYGLVILLAGWLAGWLISSQISSEITSIMFYEGLIVLILALMASMKGNPSGINTQGAGQRGNQAIQHENLHVTREERKSTDYHKHFLNHSVTDFAFSSFTLMFGGILLMVVSFILG